MKFLKFESNRKPGLQHRRQHLSVLCPPGGLVVELAQLQRVHARLQALAGCTGAGTSKLLVCAETESLSARSPTQRENSQKYV